MPDRMALGPAWEKLDTALPRQLFDDAARYASQAVRSPPPLTLGEPEIAGL
jgi:hypothetical protein